MNDNMDMLEDFPESGQDYTNQLEIENQALKKRVKELETDDSEYARNLALRHAFAEQEARIAQLEEENKELQKEVDFLDALRSYGVDNWHGYEAAADEWRETHKDEDDD